MIDLERVDFAKGSGLVPVICQDARSGAVLMLAYANREALERTAATGEMHYWSRSRGLWHKGATSGNVQRVVELRQDCDGDAILARVEAAGPACHTGAESCFGRIGEISGALGRLDAVIRLRASGAGAATGSRADDSVAPDIESLPEDTPSARDSEAGREAQHRSSATRGKSAQAGPPAAGDNTENRRDSHQPGAPTTERQKSYTQQLLADRNLRLKKLGEEAAEFVTACADGDRQRATEEAADLIYHTLVALNATGASLRDVEQVLARRDRTLDVAQRPSSLS